MVASAARGVRARTSRWRTERQAWIRSSGLRRRVPKHIVARRVSQNQVDLQKVLQDFKGQVWDDYVAVKHTDKLKTARRPLLKRGSMPKGQVWDDSVAVKHTDKSKTARRPSPKRGSTRKLRAKQRKKEIEKITIEA